MRRSTSFKKRILLLVLIPACCLLAVLVPLWFFMHYRFKESLKYLVARESRGRFTFDASDAGISLWKGTITLKDAILYDHDSAAGISCKTSIREIYFSLASWKALIVDKKLMVDSAAIIEPMIDLQVRKLNTNRSHPEFHTSDILDALAKTLAHLNVHAFSLKDASFKVTTPGSSDPLHGEHIDLVVSNFASLTGQDNHFLGSDKVSLSLGPQHWILAEDKQMIDFSRLSFDSREQRFELDSFFFRQKVAGSERTFRLSADRFFFNSRHLSAIYQQSQLLLDTLICINPVLSIPADTTIKQHPDSIAEAVHKTLFKWINIRFVEVIGGRVLVQNKTGKAGNASTRSANLRIYNLRVDPSKPAPLSSDSIRMDLKNIQFLTRDSLYRLSIGAFELHGNDAIFDKVSYGPTRPGLAKQVVFTSPSLLVKNISIPDLLHKHIHASAAQLMAPQIQMSDNRETDTANQNRRQAANAKKIALFYHTLHNIRELIDTRDFDIIDGSVNYIHTGRVPVTATFTHLSAHILLNKFFISDSLVDIKHAIPDWRIGRFELVAPGLHAAVDNYVFNGLGNHSMGEQFHLSTNKGWQFDGNNFSWDVLDWDLYQRSNAIQIDSLHLRNLIVHAPKGDSASNGSTLKKPLPAIHIAVLDVDSITFDQPNAYGALHFGIDRLHATGIRSSQQTFVWDHVNTILHDIGLDTKQGRVDIRQLQFDSERGVSAKDLSIDGSLKGHHAGLVAPIVTINADWHSGDPKLLKIASVTVPNAKVVYTGTIGKDTLTAHGLLTIEAQPTQLEPSFSSSINVSWKETDLAIRGNSLHLQATQLSGAFHDKTFEVPNTAAANNLDHWLNQISIFTANLTLTTKKLTARAAYCSWDPNANRLDLTNFSILPNAARDETFRQSRWQTDYVTLEGGSLTLSGLKPTFISKRLSVRAEKVILDHVSVEASRDKHMPFHHGIEKPMPTKLIGTIPLAIRVDTTLLIDDKVTYHELSLATNRWSTIPITNISGYIANLASRTGMADTLKIEARARLFDGDIRRFFYTESYGDSLSAFTAKSSFSRLDLTRFSAALIPAAAVSVTDGHVDTAWSAWQGNKYATDGILDLDYSKLKIKVLNKKDSVHRGVLPAFETWAARVLLRNKNTKSSIIWFERDREKFVFNYWVKAQASGVLSTLLRIKNDQYRKAFGQKYREYKLTPGGMAISRQ
jgi:hypothetical protein